MSTSLCTPASVAAPCRELAVIEPAARAHFRLLAQALSRYGFAWKLLRTQRSRTSVRYRASFREGSAPVRFHLELFASCALCCGHAKERTVRLHLALYLAFSRNGMQRHEHLLPPVEVDCGAPEAFAAQAESLQRLLQQRFDASVAASLAHERLRP